MNRYVPAVLLLLYGADALAGSPAVEATNFELGITAGDTYTSGDRDSNTYQLNAAVTFPLARYLGASLSGYYGKSNVGRAFRTQTGVTTAATAPPTAEIAFANVNADFFVRDPNVGRLGVRYGVGQQRSEGDATFLQTGTDTLDTETYAASAEYYLSRVTLVATRTQTDLDGVTFDSAEFVARYYATDNLRLSVSIGGLDLEESYGVGVSYQPRFLTDSATLQLSYVQEDRTVETHFVMIGFAVYFGASDDLIVIDRRYR